MSEHEIPPQVAQRIREDDARLNPKRSSGAFIRFWRQCNHDVPPLFSSSTKREEQSDGRVLIGYIVHPAVCPQCGKPWQQGPVEQAID